MMHVRELLSQTSRDAGFAKADFRIGYYDRVGGKWF